MPRSQDGRRRADDQSLRHREMRCGRQRRRGSLARINNSPSTTPYRLHYHHFHLHLLLFLFYNNKKEQILPYWNLHHSLSRLATVPTPPACIAPIPCASPALQPLPRSRTLPHQPRPRSRGVSLAKPASVGLLHFIRH